MLTMKNTNQKKPIPKGTWVRDYSPETDTKLKRLIGKTCVINLNGINKKAVKWINGTVTLIISPENLRKVKI